MNQPPKPKKQHRRWRSFERLEDRILLAADVVMFNDHVSGPATSPFATTYASFATASGFLRDSATGADTSITLTTQASGAFFENTTGVPSPGTDAHDLFADWVDFSSQPGASIAVSGANSYTHSFSDLDPGATYEFVGTAVRGFAGYTNRWTLVTLVGADSFTSAHSDGLGIVTTGLAVNQVAVWTGANHQAGQGFVAQWTDIDAGADGLFSVVSSQYQGPTPGVGSGNSTGASKGYALAAVRLLEQDQSFRVIASDPPSGAALTQAPTTYTIDFSAPIDVSTVEASDFMVDGSPATAVQVVDADTLTFTLPVVTGEGFHFVSIAEGAISDQASGLPLTAFADSFALLSGSGVVINEIHYDSGSDAEPLEFVELFNAGDTSIDLSGWTLADAVSFTVPNGTMLGSGEYLVVAQNVAEFSSHFGVSAAGPFSGRLSNGGETIVLRDSSGVKQDEVDYNLGFPWPTIGEITGHSIQLINPALENDLGGNWRSAMATPGAASSVFEFNSAPQMRQVSHSPKAPVSGEDVTITMKVTDPEGVDDVTLEYQLVDPGDYIEIIDPRYATQWTAVAMVDDGANGDLVAGDDIYTAVLPGNLQTHRRLVRYRVTATDTLGAQVTAPYADDAQPNFAYFVYDQTPDWTGAAQPGVTPSVTYDGELLDSVATYHLITTRTDHVDSQHIPDSSASAYGGSEYLWHGALVYDGEVYDHIRYRARGGVWRYAMGKNMWKFDFNRGHSFEARDNYGEKYQADWSKLNLSAVISQGFSQHRGEQGLFESAGFKLFNLAGVEAPHTNYTQFRIIESADENGADQYSSDFQGLYLAIEQLDDQFLEQHDLPDGNLYKMENGSGVGGIGGELNNQGDYPAVSDSSDLISFKTTYESGVQTAQWWKDNLDLDSYYSYRSIVEGIHHYDIGFGKNYFFYLNPDTNKWVTVPWDLDLTWADNQFGNGNEPFNSRVLPIAEFSLEYRNRMRELRDLLYNSDQTGAVIDEMASFVYTPGEDSLVDADRAMWDYNPILASSYVNSGQAGQGRFYAGGGSVPATGSYAGGIQRMKDYVASRSNWIDTNVLTDESLIPSTPTLSYTGGAGFPIDELQFTSSTFSSSNSSFAAMEWRIGEISNPSTSSFDPNVEWTYEIDPVWKSGELTSFSAISDASGAVLNVGDTYRARVRMQDSAGRWSHWSDAVEFVAAPAVALPTLSITELHYHPNNSQLQDPSDQEFIEILNTGLEPVGLAGVQIADFASQPYVFGAGQTLEAGEYIVVARTPAVFESVYGTEINLAVDGFGGASLSNGGETVTLRSSAGAIIQSFTYDDNSPWPEAADGAGASLEIIDPVGDPSDPANWRASAAVGGSPGNDGNAPPFLAGDYDASGTVDSLDYQLWKSDFGNTVTTAGDGADGNSNGIIDAGDYAIWRENLGATTGSTAGSAPTLAAASSSSPIESITPLAFDSALADYSARKSSLLQDAPLTPPVVQPIAAARFAWLIPTQSAYPTLTPLENKLAAEQQQSRDESFQVALDDIFSNWWQSGPWT